MHPANPRLHERLTLFGAVVHGGGKGGGGSTTTVQQADPWKGQQPYLEQLFGAASNQLQQGSTVVPFSPDTLSAQQMTRDLVHQGGTLPLATNRNASLIAGIGTGPFDTQLIREAQGEYLNANPYVDAMYNQAADQVTNRFHSAFGGSGRFGSPSHQRELAGGLADMATNIYGANYAQERDRQQLAARTGLSAMNQAIARTPQLDQAAFIPAQMLGGVGGQIEGLQQAIANRPAADLAQFAGLIQGGYGGTTTTRGSGGGVNPAAGLLGGAATGAGIGAAMGLSNPWIGGLAAGGALLGLL